MQYIVLDMEWNQPWPGSYAARQVLPVQIHGEIIQIGAVRMTENGKVADEFQVLVRPKYYKKLNSRVSKLTGLRHATLREEGLPFPEAIMRGDSNWSAASNWDQVDLEDYDKNFTNPRSMLFDIPARRPAFPSEMAGLVVYLISDDATYTTGQVISVDGGWTACYSGDY